MKLRKTSACGGFSAWGIGFLYMFDAKERILEVFHEKKHKPLIYIDFDPLACRAAEPYVVYLEKTTQIKALMFSNNTSVDLANSFDTDKLSPILCNSVRIARYALDLKNGEYQRFSQFFTADQGLKDFSIKKIAPTNINDGFFSLSLMTENNNSVSVRSSKLSTALLFLAEKIVQDLVLMELNHRSQNMAHSLLKVSSKLSHLSHVLDDSFVPRKKLVRKKNFHNQSSQNLLRSGA